MTKRRNRYSKHHLTPKSRGGKKNFQNILMLKPNRHESWHVLFKNKTLEEIISILTRVKRAKRGGK